MENQSVFKTSLFGGFDRQSVLSYIYEMNNNAKAVQDRLGAQLEEVGAAREKLEESIRTLEQKLGAAEQMRESLHSELSGEKAKTSELGRMMESLNEEIARQNRIIEEKDAEIGRFGAIKQELEQKNAELEGKKQEVEKASVYLSDMIIRARLDAENIIADANNQAREVADQATQSLSAVFDQFDKFRSEMESIEEKIEEAVISMQSKFAAIGEALGESEHRIRNFYRPYNLKLVGEPQPEEDSQNNFFRGAAE